MIICYGAEKMIEKMNTMKSVADLSFEEALQELESIVRKLEDGNMPLADSVKIYERGILLKNHCEAHLKSAQLKIEEVMGSAQNVETKPFVIEE